MKNIILIVLLTVLCTCLFAEKIQSFSLEDINGKKLVSSELLKKGPIVIDFWATSCGPCMKALPSLSKLTEKYSDVTFIAVSADTPKSKDKVLRTVKSNGFKFKVVLDSNKEMQKMFNISDIPQTFVINQRGEITFHHSGYIPGDEKKLDEEIAKVAKGK